MSNSLVKGGLTQVTATKEIGKDVKIHELGCKNNC